MGLRPGYKRTELGVIPEEWGIAPFSELFEFRNGVNAEKQAYGKGVRFINVLDVITHSHLEACDIPGRVSLPAGTVDSFTVRRGDVLFNRTSETQQEVGLSSVYVDDVPVVFGGFVIRGRPRGDAVDPTYSGYAFRAPRVRSQIIAKGQGAIRANIGQSDLRQVVAPLPSPPEQQAIAGALRDVDALIRALDQLVAKKLDLKQAAMQQLFTGQTRLPGFTEEWDLKRLGDVADMRSGGTPSSSVPDHYGGDIPWVSISDMTRGGKVVVTTERNLTRLGLERSAAVIYPAGTLLYAMYASIGECSIAGVPVSSSQAILGIRPKEGVVTEFLYYWLCSLRTVVQKLGQQGTQPNLNGGIVRSLAIRLPKLPEQTAIAAVLSDMDEELATLEQRLAKTRALKQGMMQELLTGKARLV